jgi:hypothetical protein
MVVTGQETVGIDRNKDKRGVEHIGRDEQSLATTRCAAIGEVTQHRQQGPPPEIEQVCCPKVGRTPEVKHPQVRKIQVQN